MSGPSRAHIKSILAYFRSKHKEHIKPPEETTPFANTPGGSLPMPSCLQPSVYKGLPRPHQRGPLYPGAPEEHFPPSALAGDQHLEGASQGHRDENALMTPSSLAGGRGRGFLSACSQ